MTFTDEQQRKLARAQEILGRFMDEQLPLSAITHPRPPRCLVILYERLEFSATAFPAPSEELIASDRFHDPDEGGLTRIKVALVSGAKVRPMSPSA